MYVTIAASDAPFRRDGCKRLGQILLGAQNSVHRAEGLYPLGREHIKVGQGRIVLCGVLKLHSVLKLLADSVFDRIDHFVL